MKLFLFTLLFKGPFQGISANIPLFFRAPSVPLVFEGFRGQGSKPYKGTHERTLTGSSKPYRSLIKGALRGSLLDYLKEP